ncbi:hypothetical protein GWI33_007908 [Rhynchophorus ferrugineus]|uniref:Uncharacterized protein n=1 Tax=Rhynchophorus ferrugineus TaxID=354439 RepID=A0A834IJ98_RHYFE|nr:hypothetical protein GWI33_007908 [Rhynchophorus ferrugineus]
MGIGNGRNGSLFRRTSFGNGLDRHLGKPCPKIQSDVGACPGPVGDDHQEASLYTRHRPSNKSGKAGRKQIVETWQDVPKLLQIQFNGPNDLVQIPSRSA